MECICWFFTFLVQTMVHLDHNFKMFFKRNWSFINRFEHAKIMVRVVVYFKDVFTNNNNVDYWECILNMILGFEHLSLLFVCFFYLFGRFFLGGGVCPFFRQLHFCRHIFLNKSKLIRKMQSINSLTPLHVIFNDNLLARWQKFPLPSPS